MQSATNGKRRKPPDPDAAYCEHQDSFMAAHERYPNAVERYTLVQAVVLAARPRVRKRHLPKEVLKGGRGKRHEKSLAENPAKGYSLGLGRLFKTKMCL
jgi:hypothetical protein